MIFTYQMFHGGVDVEVTDLFRPAVGAVTRGHPYKLHKPEAVSRLRRSAFAVRAVNAWNGLPAEVVCAPTVNSFKARLDAHWAQHWYQIPDTD